MGTGEVLLAIFFTLAVSVGALLMGYFVFLLLREIYKKTPCGWSINVDGIWDTKCRETFYTEIDGPVTDWATYCPYCGRPIKVKS